MSTTEIVTTDQLLTAEDLAARWQLTGTAAIYRLSREKKIPTVKLGRYYRYRLADVEEFEAAGGTGGGQR